MRKFAVIDIGSNSVRLVVYESLKRAPYVIFNEKILCGLGRGLAETGIMQAGPMDLAIRNLKRFRIMLRKMDVKKFRVVATSAVREARNGPAFVHRIKTECQLDVSVISGEEEARLSGLGVLCALPGATGVVGDLGGGSLEIARLLAGKVTQKESFAIGPLKYQSLAGKTVASPKADIDRAIQSLDWVAEHPRENFYAVGGSWRTLAKIHIVENGYALNNVHHYTINREEALRFTERLSAMESADFNRYANLVSARRIRVLPLSAYMLNRLIRKLKSKRLIISGYGLREGLLFEAMAPKIRRQDPLIEACYDIASSRGRFSEHGKRMQKWIDPLFPEETPGEKRLRLAASILSDVGWRGHPEYRSEKVLYEVLHGRLLGVEHRGAALIGLALYVCYGGKLGEEQTAKEETLIRKPDIIHVNQVGLALRLAQRISGGTEKGLKAASLNVSDGKLFLNFRKKDADMAGEVVMERLTKLAQSFGLTAEIRINP